MHTGTPWVLETVRTSCGVCHKIGPFPWMAAAPDMLEALRGVLRVADRDTVEFDAVRAAIAKATQP